MEEQKSQQQSPELTVTDLMNLKSVIEVATKRGAFNASELSSIGLVYDKLNKFLSSIPSASPDTQPQG